MGLTPMMKQYLEVKEKCKDCILFFRLGDFYEMFFEDAEKASKELELVLTGRDCGLEKRAPMCGIPYHAANTYISKLVSRGYKIAICEQLEDPSQAKGIVKRDIIKIITPGTYTDSSFLTDKENNFIMSLYIDEKYTEVGICFADISTGEFNCTNCEYDESTILDEISKFEPREILIQDTLDDSILSKIKERFVTAFSKSDNNFFVSDALNNIHTQFSNFDLDKIPQALINASNGLLKYINETQKINLSNINEINYYSIVDYLSIDINSRRNLELTETLREKSRKGSLLWVVDKTNTAMGARELRKWIEQPLINKSKIQNRLDSVEELIRNISLHKDLKEALKSIYDIERLAGKVSSKSINAREMISLKNSLERIPDVKFILRNFNSKLLNQMYNNLDELKDIYNLINNSISDNPSLSVKEGNIIKDGYDKRIDELRNAKKHGKEWIVKLESSEKETTGIKSLKISYNKVFGYFIEVRKTNLELVPEDRYIRKQTLANSERYITPELKQIEEKLLGAEEKLTELEYTLFVQIRDEIEKHIHRLKNTAKIIAKLDCLSSLAAVALDNNYCKPELNTEGFISVESGRHPVVEKMIPVGTFIENNTDLNDKDNQLLIITGPNMAGKSTYMRQVALIVLMAQIGSFVPAKKANISICDKIFTRIGASDDLASGKSTFMVEMSEVSNILKNATNKSLILLDEVGRGTSTYDGLSIAWSVIEYICKNKNLRSKTLFATHYHELTTLEGKIEGVKNYCVSVKKVGSDIVFLRKIIPGGADQSYGIEVAKLAGLPTEVLSRARDILDELEENKSNEDKNKINKVIEHNCNEEYNSCDKKDKPEKNKNIVVKEAAVDKVYHEDETKSEPIQISFSDLEKNELLEYIKQIDILNLTPMDGFNELYKIVKKSKML
ncbi:DNA mismatch repair protein MutS [Haloimpatiens sp. FM7330]|uniref:DNA mismatch repair protein MutS n=1 Tax=Haloimpatiens sp. FM7330 TaxID=3298610 RepID=UPI0036321F28